MNNESDNSRQVAVLFIVLQSVLYGFGDPISKAAYASVPVYSLLTLRYGIALGLMLLVSGRHVFCVLQKTKTKNWIASVFCMAGAYVVGNIALIYSEATVVAFIRSMPTILAPLLAFLAYRKKYCLYHLPFQSIVVLGLYLLCCSDGIRSFGRGELCALICAAFLAGALVFGEKALETIDSITLSSLQTGASLLVAAICALSSDRGFCFDGIGTSELLIIIYLAVFCTISGYLLQNAALQRAPAFLVALVQSLGPIMTAFFSFLILKERLSVKGILGAGLILICVIGDTVAGECYHRKNRVSAGSQGTET